MDFMLPFHLPKSLQQISHQHKILSVGSCFTEHIGNALMELKFSVLQNPNGILFDPLSVCSSLISYIEPKQYSAADLFYLNELWQSWQHHSRFSGTNQDEVLDKINQAQNEAHQFLRQADWLIVTLGSSFSYQLADEQLKPVANCHRAPAQAFKKNLLSTNETVDALHNTLARLHSFNPNLKIIFTISPVRHIRDGVVENNRSKARLIEAVHTIVETFSNTAYFPAYEIVIDVLRDYRFYDVDLVHPNYPATEYVLQKFTEVYMNEETIKLMSELKKIAIARKHKPAHPATEAHQRFLQAQLQKTIALQDQYPYLNLSKEFEYFAQKH